MRRSAEAVAASAGGVAGPVGGHFVPRTSSKCPNCGTPVKQGDIICVKCGTNLLTGQQIVAQPQAEVARGGGRGLVRLILVLLVLAVLAGGVGGGYYLLVYNEPVTKAKRQAGQGNLLEAVQVLNVYTESHKTNADAFALLGQYEYRSGRFGEALNALEAAAKLRPRDAELNYQVVVAATRAPGGGLNQQIAAYRRIVEAEPGNAEAKHLLAMALGAAGQYAEQVELLQAVNDASPSPETTRNLGIAKALAGDVAGGAAFVAVGPDDQNKALVSGLMASMQGRAEEALQALQAGIAGDAAAQNAYAATQVGLLLMAQGDFERAATALRGVSVQDDAPDAARFFYAVALQHAKLETEAMTEFADLAQKSGEYAQEAAAQMAVIYLAQENLPKAEEALRQASVGGKKSAKIHTLEGALAARAGDRNQAQQSFRMALQADPNYAPAHLELGLVYVGEQRIAEGVKELQKYLELAGDAKEARGPEIKLLLGQLELTLERQGGAPPPPTAPAPAEEVPAEEVPAEVAPATEENVS